MRKPLTEAQEAALFRAVDDDGMLGLCQTGRPHEFDGVECRWCGSEPYTPDDDRPAGWYAPEPYPGHVCFDDCRHRR